MRLEARKLSVLRGGREVLTIGHLGVEPGEVLAIIGPNGAGKSTLLQALGLLIPFKGEVLIDGESVRDRLRARRRMAMVFQDPLLLNTSTLDNVSVGLRMRKVSGKQARKTAGHWLERFGVGALAARNARSLSGGEAQRVALARAFALDPDVLLLDEPFAALDAPTREELLADLEGVLRQTGVATILVSHDRDEALRLADRIAVILDGRLRQLGSAGQIFSAPADPEVAQFVGIETIVEGRVEAEENGVNLIAVGEARVAASGELAMGAGVLVCLRPEDITLLSEQPSASSARNHLWGTISRVGGAGRLIRVEIDCGFPVVALVTRLSAEELDLQAGARIVAVFKASAVHLIPHHGRKTDAISGAPGL